MDEEKAAAARRKEAEQQADAAQKKVDDAAAAEIFTKIQNAFEPTFCHFLQVLKNFARPFRTLSSGQL